MNLSPPRSPESESRLVAVVMAAVQVYLDEEALASEAHVDPQVSAWRLAVRGDPMDTRSWRRPPWKGSD